MEYYIANVSFSGKISMHEGEIRIISNKTLIKDLTKAGYIRKLNKKEIEAMKVLGLIKEQEQVQEVDEQDEPETQDDSEISDEDVVTDEGE